MINTVSSASRVQINAAKQISDITPASHSKTDPVCPDSSSDNSTLSTLSRQLAGSAVRAEARDKNMDRFRLGVEADRIRMGIVESDWQSDETGYVLELPDTTDPELLERARQATEYVARFANRNPGAKNPFAGLSREQLNLIAYDEKGPYTQHERSAAYTAVNYMELEWNRSLWEPKRRESDANDGRCPQFLTEILAHYRTLDPIEQAQYPDIYESRLEREIKVDSDPSSVKKKDALRIPYLFEILARYGILDKEEKPGILDILPDSDLSTPAGVSPTAAITTSSLSPDASPSPAAAERS